MNAASSKTNYQQVSMILLTLATALIHVGLAIKAFGMGDMTTTIMFTLNGLGYIGLLAAYRLPLPFAKDHRALLRWAFIAFTAVTILAWVAIGDKTLPGGALGYITKLIEITLLVLLWVDRNK